MQCPNCMREWKPVEVCEHCQEEAEKREERERMCHAACGVVATANTRESAAEQRKMKPEYYSASVQAVADAVDREMELRERLTWRPIETAPLDGTEVLLFGKYPAGSSIMIARYVRRGDVSPRLPCGWYIAGFAFNRFNNPTHWMALPDKPPELELEKDREVPNRLKVPPIAPGSKRLRFSETTKILELQIKPGKWMIVGGQVAPSVASAVAQVEWANHAKEDPGTLAEIIKIQGEWRKWVEVPEAYRCKVCGEDTRPGPCFCGRICSTNTPTRCNGQTQGD